MYRKSVVLAGCLTIGLALAQQPAQSPQQAAAVQFQRAVYAQNTTGDLDSAIQKYRAIIASNPGQRDIAARAQYHLAQALLQKGDLMGAAQEFQTLASNYPDYTDLVRSMASATALFDVNNAEPIGTFRNGRFYHKLTGIEFNAPSGWNLSHQGKSSDNGESVTFKDPQSGIEVDVWMKPDGVDASKIDGWLDHDAARKHEDRGPEWTLRPGGVRRTVGGQKALSVAADLSNLEGHRYVELLTWVRTTTCRAQFYGEATVEQVALLQNALEQMLASAKLP